MPAKEIDNNKCDIRRGGARPDAEIKWGISYAQNNKVEGLEILLRV